MKLCFISETLDDRSTSDGMLAVTSRTDICVSEGSLILPHSFTERMPKKLALDQRSIAELLMKNKVQAMPGLFLHSSRCSFKALYPFLPTTGSSRTPSSPQPHPNLYGAPTPLRFSPPHGREPCDLPHASLLRRYPGLRPRNSWTRAPLSRPVEHAPPSRGTNPPSGASSLTPAKTALIPTP